MKSTRRKQIPCMLHLCLVVAACFAGAANAAPCAIDTTSTRVCPEFTACLTWTASTTREPAAGETTGAAMTADELAGYELKLNGIVKASQPGLSFDYVVPKGSTLKTTDTWSIAAIDLKGQKSTVPYSCTQPSVVAGPKFPPAAPAGLKTGTAKP